jgi:hypothetical protein
MRWRAVASRATPSKIAPPLALSIEPAYSPSISSVSCSSVSGLEDRLAVVLTVCAEPGDAAANATAAPPASSARRVIAPSVLAGWRSDWIDVDS